MIFHDSLNGQPFPFDYMNSLGNGIPAPEARELAAVGRALYNRWLVDFCSVEPERNVGLAQLPFWDIDAIDRRARVVRRARPGRGQLPCARASPGSLLSSHPRWTASSRPARSSGMTLATHIGAMPPASEYLEYGDPTHEGTFHFGLLDSGEWGVRTVYELSIFGVFERHPHLKLVLTEVPGVFWNEMCLKMDSLQKTPIRRKEQALPRLPSEYAATNVWMGNSFQSRQEAEAAIGIGREDRFLWGSDYPHPEGTYSYPDDPDEIPMTRLSLAFTYHGLPLEKVRMILGENALQRISLPRCRCLEQSRRSGRHQSWRDRLSTGDGEPQVRSRAWHPGFRTEGPWN